MSFAKSLQLRSSSTPTTPVHGNSGGGYGSTLTEVPASPLDSKATIYLGKDPSLFDGYRLRFEHELPVKVRRMQQRTSCPMP